MQYDPAGQDEQVALPALDLYFPASQTVHEPVVALPPYPALHEQSARASDPAGLLEFDGQLFGHERVPLVP